MDSWEKAVKVEYEKCQEKAEESFHPEKDWQAAVKKRKKKAKKGFVRQVQAAQKYMPKDTGMWENKNEIDGNGMPGEMDTWEGQYNPEAGRKEDIHYTNKSNLPSANRKPTVSGVPSLCECAKRLKEKVRITCVEGRLYCFDKFCYQAVDRTKLVQLYRDYVDRNLHGARNVKGFYELYSYLLTDSKIQIQPKPVQVSNLAILNNGIYNVEKGRLEPFNPSVIAFSYVDAAYVENAKCPKFDEFLRDVTGNNEILIKRLWRFLGYVFTQSLDAKAFFVMGCAPNSGKSLLGKFIMKLYKPQYVSSIALSDFNGDFSMSTLVGAAVNVSLDLPSSKLSTTAVSKLKMLTGGDLVTINEKYISQFKYQNRAKFIFASNHPIQLVEDDEAFWERLVYLPFNYSVNKSEQDTGLLNKLLKEKDAVVSKALKYARKLMQENYIFPTTDEIERQIRKWRGIEIDTINAFLAEMCQTGEEYEGETMDDLYEAYGEYCQENGETAQKQTTLKKYLEDQVGLEHIKSRFGKAGNPKSAFSGIKLCRHKQ